MKNIAKNVVSDSNYRKTL